ALEEFRTASRIDPTEVMPVYNTGLVFRMMGRKETALSRFLEAERLGGNRFEVSFQIARTCQELNRLTQAAAHFDQAVRLKPTSAIAHRLLGECRAALGRTEEAVAAYKKAVKLNPGDAEAISMLGVLFDKLGENPEIAVLFCRHSVEIAPKNGLYRQRLAKLYLKHTRPDEAMAEFEVAARLGCHSEEESEEEIGPLYPRQTHRAS
ncbi:MAG: tetratricopeptide repeat protein, partial [Thermodesulfobacteriota bacterium]